MCRLPEIEHVHAVHQRIATAGCIRERIEERGLADARLATQDDRTPSPRRRDPLEQREQHRKLGAASREEPARRLRRVRERPDDPMRTGWLPGSERHHQVAVGDLRRDVRRDRDLARARAARPVAGQGHGSSRERERLRIGGRQHLPLRDAHRELWASTLTHYIARGQFERCPDGMLDLVARERAQAECCDRFALAWSVDPAPVPADDGGNSRVRLRNQVARRLGVVVRPGGRHARDEDHGLTQRNRGRTRFRVTGRRAGGRRRFPIRVACRRVRRSAAPPPQERAEQGIGGRFGCDVEVTTQRLAAGAILAHCIGVTSLARVGLHEVALGAFARRLDPNQPFQRGNGAGLVARRGALRRQPLRRCEEQAPQLAPLLPEPLLEGRGTRIEPLEQQARVTLDGAGERAW